MDHASASLPSACMDCKDAKVRSYLSFNPRRNAKLLVALRMLQTLSLLTEIPILKWYRDGSLAPYSLIYPQGPM